MKHLFTIGIVYLIHTVSLSADPQRPAIQAGDVVFMYAANPPSLYDAFHGTVSGWGGRAASRDPQAVEHFRQQVDEAHRREMKYCGSVDFLVDFGGFIDFAPNTFMKAVCRDLNGDPLQVPWLWDHKHKGYPAYWFCTNHPEYQKYLFDQTERACLAPIDGLHIDDYSGTSSCSDYNGGCFCSYCMDGFRQYLKQTYSPETLREWGIPDIELFHYQTYLKAKVITADDYKRKTKDDPLRILFQDYQNEQMKQHITAVYEHAEDLRGMPLLRSVNSSASSPRTVIPSPIIDYFCGEIHQDAAGKHISSEPVFVYRMVESLGDRQTATASGQDWAWIKAYEKPGMVRMWIAQAYAFGSVFMVPHNQWCFTQELGTHWWHGKPEDFGYLYQFVREQTEYLDEYVSLADVALLCTNSDFDKQKHAALALVEANIPFDIIFTPDPTLAPPQSDRVRSYTTIVVDQTTQNKAEWLKDQKASVLSWNGQQELPEHLTRSVHVNGSDRVRLSLRHHPANENAPLVCHILNHNYTVESDTITPAGIEVRISKSFVRKANHVKIERATVNGPQQESQTVPVESNGTDFTFRIENLGLWAIVRLE